MAHRLLLADDSVTIQKVIELTFADEDIEVVAVGDGDQAIARLDAERFDIVLADVGMPGRDGFEVAAHLQGRPETATVPVILLTGAFDPVDDDKVLLVGAAAVLEKPFEPQVLVAKVRELLARGAGAPAPAADVSAAETLLAPPPTVQGPSVDDYFERLDRAFANLNVPLEPRDPGAPVSAPLSIAPAPVEPPPTASPAAVSSQPTGLADAFSRLLAVEQGELPAAALAEPAPTSEDELVDRVARRVVEQLSNHAVRDLAADIVSRTAERLVREEIERIKTGMGE
jgi:DNA-binding response OmpR family regulator